MASKLRALAAPGTPGECAQKKRTCCFIGNGDTPMVHHPQFAFNPANLPRGAAYWVALAEGYMR